MWELIFNVILITFFIRLKVTNFLTIDRQGLKSLTCFKSVDKIIGFNSKSVELFNSNIKFKMIVYIYFLLELIKDSFDSFSSFKILKQSSILYNKS